MLYGPNGTGKTSLATVLRGDDGIAVFEIGDAKYSLPEDKDKFYVIGDQQSRNIINGTAKDFIMGDDIRRENELDKKCAEEKAKLIDGLRTSLRSIGITSKSSPLAECLSSVIDDGFIKYIANRNSPDYSRYDDSELISILDKCTKRAEVPEELKEKCEYYRDNAGDFINLKKTLNDVLRCFSKVAGVQQYREDEVAIGILTKSTGRDCIVCETKDIDREKLLEQKEERRATFKSELEKQQENLLNAAEKVGNAMFDAEQIIMDALESGDDEHINCLLSEFNQLEKTALRRMR